MQTPQKSTISQIHLPTLMAIAVVAYVLSNVLHEALGHGGACVWVGGQPRVVTSVHFSCQIDETLPWARRFLAAGGSVVNLLTGGIAWLALRTIRRAGPRLRYFLWLLMTVNCLQAGGYLMVSPLAGIGDWRVFAQGFASPLPVRLLLTALGIAISWVTLRVAVPGLLPFVGNQPTESRRRARLLTLVPYLTGGISACLAGLLNPVGPLLIFISAIASTFGGTAWLAWLPSWIKPEHLATAPPTPLPIARSLPWIAAGTLLLILFITLLGPGIPLGP